MKTISIDMAFVEFSKIKFKFIFFLNDFRMN